MIFCLNQLLDESLACSAAPSVMSEVFGLLLAPNPKQLLHPSLLLTNRQILPLFRQRLLSLALPRIKVLLKEKVWRCREELVDEMNNCHQLDSLRSHILTWPEKNPPFNASPNSSNRVSNVGACCELSLVLANGSDELDYFHRIQ